MNNLSKRKILRLKNYDYSQSGMYYVTISTNHKQKLFGHVKNEQFIPNEAGKMIACHLKRVENRFKNVDIDYYVIMPDHIHAIIDKTKAVGHGDPTLQQILQWYKSITTHEYSKGVKTCIFKAYNKYLWQRSYYEHIIRNEKDLNEIRKYIQDNPLKQCLEDA